MPALLDSRAIFVLIAGEAKRLAERDGGDRILRNAVEERVEEARHPLDLRRRIDLGVDPAPRAGGSGTTYQGTVYGAGTESPGYATIGFQAGFPAPNPVENTGSLTGHILAQGWPDTPETSGGNNTKVLVVLAVALLVAVGVSAFVVFAAGDILDALFGNA